MDWTRGHILGRGSSATVSIATSTSGDLFAVKSIDLSQSESLQREQQFLSILSSPYVVSYKGCDITKENNKLMYNLMMQYMSGGTLIDAVNSHGKFNNLEIVRYTRQIVQGLEYLHSSGIVHCDIKGRNILIGESGAKIADLGCAKWANQSAPLCGTPMFMAPEVARGEEQGLPADIWALGCTVIEMATGGPPWPNANDPVSVLYKIAYSGEIPDIPDNFSDEAKDFVSKCLIRDPKERWTAKQLLKHPYLEQFTGNQDQIICQKIRTISPTSILDQDVWNSMEEESRSVGTDCVQTTSPRQRIKQLADNSETSNWRSTEDWITIRGHVDGDVKANNGEVTGVVEDEMEGYCAMSGGEEDDDELLIKFLDATNVSCRRHSCSVMSSNCNGCEHKPNLLLLDSPFFRHRRAFL